MEKKQASIIKGIKWASTCSTRTHISVYVYACVSHLPKLLLHREHLIHDLMGHKVARKATFAGGTEGAPHGTPHLGAHAYRQPWPVRVIHRDAHAFHDEPVVQLKQELAGAI